MGMDLLKAMNMASMGMKTQGIRMRIISENLANSNTTAKSPNDLPYQRQMVTFKNILNRRTGVSEIAIGNIIKDTSDFGMKYDPAHPAADEKGYIKTPNVNSLVEMMDMREAQRSYEANLGMIEISKSMLMRTVDLLRS